MYQEYQKIRSWWIRIPILISSLFCIYICLQQILFSQSLTDSATTDIIVVVIILIIGIGIPAFVQLVRLETTIQEQNLNVKYWPFHLKPIKFAIIDIKKAEAITYNPIKDYGGWGIRYGIKGKAYTLNGNKGVLLTFNNTQKILIGSQNHKKLCASINEILGNMIQ
ncbi:MAG: hypothetical protein FI687_03265 [SAR202 cluster bacterium]|nr:hypothetical protein [SAR202 cluster bacterium]|tara:strand:- start:27791 stop:28288 length:498 start_codon:yes stop_codon:yes gene_type:complete